MIKDNQLILMAKRGDGLALCKIYEKYGDDLLSLAYGFLRDKQACEDVLHDVFLSFAEKISDFELKIYKGSLKGYLATCVANQARDKLRAKKSARNRLNEVRLSAMDLQVPEQLFDDDEQLNLLCKALDRLPFEQREVIMLHLQGGLRFREIGRLKNISINTVQGRYRYGINKLRSILVNEVKK